MTYIEHLDDKFCFGKFNGCTFAEVAMYSPSYIQWVILNVEGNICVFCDSVIEELCIIFPHIIIEDWIDEVRRQRIYEYEEHMKHQEDDSYNWYDNDMSNDDCGSSYGRYSGSYAQDEMGYSDDDIDTIFDGDPDAYWNID